MKIKLLCCAILLTAAECNFRGMLSITTYWVKPPPQSVAAGFSNLVFYDNFSKFDISQDGSGKHKWYNNPWYLKQSPDDRFVETDYGLLLRTNIDDIYGSSITASPRAVEYGTIFHNGYFEASLMWNNDRNNFSAFWLFSIEHARNEADDQWCEIDIFEAYEPATYLGTVHDHRGHQHDSINPNHIQRLPPDTDFSQWNKYGLLWLAIKQANLVFQR